MDFRSKICFLNKHNTKNNEFRLHAHDCYELVYFLTGSGTTVIGEKSYPVREHSYCIIAPHTGHSECIEGYGEILFIGFTFSGKLKEGVYTSNTLSNYSLLKEIFREYKEQNVGYEVALRSLMDLLLLSVLRDSNVEGKKNKDLHFLREYIGQHADQKINFRELSAVSGYSYDHFRHLFKQKFGISPQEYMIETRLEKSRKMLLETDLSCTEIAYACGFSNAAQLSLMFKKRWGNSPTAYKIANLYKIKDNK